MSDPQQQSPGRTLRRKAAIVSIGLVVVLAALAALWCGRCHDCIANYCERQLLKI